MKEKSQEIPNHQPTEAERILSYHLASRRCHLHLVRQRALPPHRHLPAPDLPHIRAGLR
jgi:hypothetical protein